MIKRLLAFMTLFSSLSTLLCCALPALLVTLGLGANLVALLATFPQLIWVSDHKFGLFLVAGVLLVLSVYTQMRGVSQSCPSDAALAVQCRRLKHSGRVILYVSILCYLVGCFFAFVAPWVFE